MHSEMKARLTKGWSAFVLTLMVVMGGSCRGEAISILGDNQEGLLAGSSCKREKSTYDNDQQVRGSDHGTYISLLGDPGMQEERVRVALESWNFCNRVGDEGSKMPSPRLADCAQIVCSSSSSAAAATSTTAASLQGDDAGPCEAEHLVSVADNELRSGQAFPQGGFFDFDDPDAYAVEKELYLASLCETPSPAGPWHFWMIMLKNGNFDVNSGLCPSTARPPSRPFTSRQHKLAQISQENSGRGSFPRPVVPAPQMRRNITAAAEDENRHHPNSLLARHDVLPAPHKLATTKSAEAAIRSGFPRSDVAHQRPQSLASTSADVPHALPPVSTQPSSAASTTKKAQGSFPCFGPGCMNHPRIYHNSSTIPCRNASNATCDRSEAGRPTLSGSFYGTYDLEGDILQNQTINPKSSYFLVDWSKDPQSGSWFFHHVLRVNQRYPWLMLYLRADATQGLSGGYPWETRGMMVKVPESPNFKVKLTLNVIQGGGSASQFYLLDIGGCWKNDGSPCDGNTATDVTRYSEMIINPNTASWCRPSALAQCPPYHVDAKTNRRIYRNDTAHFPYAAYHLYCSPPNAQFAEPPFSVCDPYSNPQPQELMQLLPHPEWAVHGYPSRKGQGWVGDPRTWTLDVGGLSQRLYFYQDPNTELAPRKWTSVDVGTEIYISQQAETAEWIVSDFDVLSSDSNPT